MNALPKISAEHGQDADVRTIAARIIVAINAGQYVWSPDVHLAIDRAGRPVRADSPHAHLLTLCGLIIRTARQLQINTASLSLATRFSTLAGFPGVGSMTDWEKAEGRTKHDITALCDIVAGRMCV